MNDKSRRLATVLTGQKTSDGAGVKLTRIISPNTNNRFDPFILLDEFGSDETSDYIGGFPSHPHRGFETVTYMLEGTLLHRDHLGNEGHLRAGDVQWMTAAHGIIHSEMPEQTNGLLRGFQLWINLPAKEKMQAPRYRDIAASEIPCITLEGGGYVKIIAGSFNTGTQIMNGAVTNISTEPFYYDVLLTAHQTLSLVISPRHTVIIYVYSGELSIGDAATPLKVGELGQLVAGDEVKVTTDDHAAQYLFLAALPINEPMVQSGPFVMNSQEEIDQAFRDYRNGVLTH